MMALLGLLEMQVQEPRQLLANVSEQKRADRTISIASPGKDKNCCEVCLRSLGWIRQAYAVADHDHVLQGGAHVALHKNIPVVLSQQLFDSVGGLRSLASGATLRRSQEQSSLAGDELG